MKEMSIPNSEPENLLRQFLAFIFFLLSNLVIYTLYLAVEMGFLDDGLYLQLLQ
jgi:hypothetical protein